MKAIYCAIFFMLLSPVCHCQDVKIKVVTHNIYNADYKDIVIAGDTIWALTDNGLVKCFNANGVMPLPAAISTSHNSLVLTKDRENMLVTADVKNNIKRFYPHLNKWKTIITAPNRVNAILFDRNNNLYAITTKGIFDARLNKTFICEKFYNHQLRLPYAWSNPSTYAIDNEGNIWIGFDEGEWGGELQEFNTTTSQFAKLNLDSLKITLRPIKSIFIHNKDVYVTTGLQHMSLLDGSINIIKDGKANNIFNSESYRVKLTDSTWEDSEYIGPGIFNEIENCIYFYSQHGIFKGSPAGSLAKINDWQNVLKTDFKWSWGRSNAVGSQINVHKLAFSNSNKLILVTQSDGIGIFDGITLTMIK